MYQVMNRVRHKHRGLTGHISQTLADGYLVLWDGWAHPTYHIEEALEAHPWARP